LKDNENGTVYYKNVILGKKKLISITLLPKKSFQIFGLKANAQMTKGGIHKAMFTAETGNFGRQRNILRNIPLYQWCTHFFS